MTIITLPYPPTANHYYGNRKGGRGKFIKPDGVKFRETVADAVSDSGAEKQAGPIRMKILVYPPDKRKRDLDNINKALLDAMQHAGLYDDDSQIFELHLIKRNPSKPGRVEVYIEQMPTEEKEIADIAETIKPVLDAYKTLDDATSKAFAPFGGLYPESDFSDAIYGTALTGLEAVEISLGADGDDWLNWFIFECDMGARPKTAEIDGEEITVDSIESLARMLWMGGARV